MVLVFLLLHFLSRSECGCVCGWVDVLPEGHFDVVSVVLDVQSLSRESW